MSEKELLLSCLPIVSEFDAFVRYFYYISFAISDNTHSRGKGKQSFRRSPTSLSSDIFYIRRSFYLKLSSFSVIYRILGTDDQWLSSQKSCLKRFIASADFVSNSVSSSFPVSGLMKPICVIFCFSYCVLLLVAGYSSAGSPLRHCL